MAWLGAAGHGVAVKARQGEVRHGMPRHGRAGQALKKHNPKLDRKETEMDIEENIVTYNGDGRDGEDEPQLTPLTVYSLGFDAEELLTAYGAIRTYLKVLANQETEDLEQIQRATKLLIALRPRAVKASKQLSLKAVGIDSGSNSA
jgi:hypothetical protein